MNLSYETSHPYASRRRRSANRNHGSVSKHRSGKSGPSLSINIKILNHRPMRTISSLAARGTQVPVKALRGINRLRQRPRPSPATTRNFAAAPSEVLNSIFSEADSKKVSDKEHHRPSEGQSLRPVDDVDDSRPIHTGSLYGQLDEILNPLKRSHIERELRDIESYSQFKRYVEHLGLICHFEDWKSNDRPESCEYDVSLLKQRTHEVETVRCSRDPEKMFHLIRTQLSRFLGEMDSETLFHPFLHGTKRLIEDYADSVCGLLGDFSGLCALYDNKCDQQRAAELLQESKIAFGRSALMCSGGGTFGMRHVGTIKTLFETGNMPQVVSGSSAGAIVCAVLCSKTDDQLQRVLDSFCHGDLKVFVGDHEKPGWEARKDYFKRNGHFFDAQNLERVMKWHLDDTTFAEAYERTGRILNITVSSADTSQPATVLNYSTAGDVLLWSAVVASCALPYTYGQSALRAKDPVTGRIDVWKEKTLHVDGSIQGDLPFDAVHEQFNTNHFIVAQVNPHVVPFLEDKSTLDRRRHPTLITFLDVLKRELADWVLPLVPIFEQRRGQLSSIVAQKYSGDITILPKDWIADLPKVLRNPTPEFMENAKRKGERATWERLSIIDNHMKIERALEAAANAAWRILDNVV